MIKSVVIDDDMHSRNTIIHDIKTYCKEVEVVGEANSVVTAVKLINEKKPDILFLDIELGDGTGFDILEICKDLKFKVIFITAYGSYGIKAIRFSAFDYLLKPVIPEELQGAIERYKETEIKFDRKASVDYLLSNIKGNKPKFNKIDLSFEDKTIFIELDDIIQCKSDSNYTIFHLKDKTTHTVSKTLKEYENLLSEFGFIRIHNSHLINIKHLKEFFKNDNYVKMSDGSEIQVSTRKRENLINFLKN